MAAVTARSLLTSDDVQSCPCVIGWLQRLLGGRCHVIG
jgi:hypothetical protein